MNLLSLCDCWDEVRITLIWMHVHVTFCCYIDNDDVFRPKSSGGSIKRSFPATTPGGKLKLQEGISVFCNNELGKQPSCLHQLRIYCCNNSSNNNNSMYVFNSFWSCSYLINILVGKNLLKVPINQIECNTCTVYICTYICVCYMYVKECIAVPFDLYKVMHMI